MFTLQAESIFNDIFDNLLLAINDNSLLSSASLIVSPINVVIGNGKFTQYFTTVKRHSKHAFTCSVFLQITQPQAK